MMLQLFMLDQKELKLCVKLIKEFLKVLYN